MHPTADTPPLVYFNHQGAGGGLTYWQVRMMSKQRDPKTVMRYDHGRENLDQNAVNIIRYDEE